MLNPRLDRQAPSRRALAALAAAGLTTSAQAAKPNLQATKVSAPPATVVGGAQFRVADSVRNAGKGRAARTRRFW